MAHVPLVAVNHHPAYHLAAVGIILVHALEARHCGKRLREVEFLHVIPCLGGIGLELGSGAVGSEELLKLRTLVADRTHARLHVIADFLVFVDFHRSLLVGNLRIHRAIVGFEKLNISATGVHKGVELAFLDGIRRPGGGEELNPLLGLHGYAVRLVHRLDGIHHDAGIESGKHLCRKGGTGHGNDVDLNRIHLSTA